MFFVLAGNKALSKHKKAETAEKKRLSLSKAQTAESRARSFRKVRLSLTKYEVVFCEAGSLEFEKYAQQLKNLKEYKEKYNMVYQRSNPAGFKEYLERTGGKWWEVNQNVGS